MLAFFAPARKAVLRGAAVVAALALAACEPGPIGGGPSANSSGPVTVALLVPKSSPTQGDGVLAASLENAARLAMADLQGAQIDLRVYDTAGNSATAAAAAQQAVSEGAQIILGPLRADAANAAGLAVAGQGVNVLSFSNNASIAGGNVFVLGNTFENTANRLASYAAKQGKRRVVVVHSTDVSGQLGRNAIQQAVSGTSASVVASVPYDLSQQSVIAAVPQVASAVTGNNADMLFLTSTTAGALPLFSQLLPDAGAGPGVVQYVGLTRWDIPTQTLALPGVQGGWFALPDPTTSQQFSQRYAAAYGGPPHPIAGLGYDGIAAVGALASSGRPLNAQSLTQGAGFQGVFGAFRFLSNGSNERALAIATIQNQQVTVIDAAPRSFGGIGF
ncbi:penicillin-binding protein activator [Marinibacterium profundimaris]|uniref:ABC transporter substrate-binding protein n=1 Tax=Marinibacterium profundimaris TaxID=1679460 RepID=A0A225NIY3_9RHOB|nr:penicillin-binding protein activator [Marinibacterium profundimaris]OWU73684.1 ABC transporter substrate-binding protein [Marinibacterium profundimaris]